MKNALWQTVLGEIELSVSHASYITWFKNTELIEHGDDKITIGVPNVFAKQQFEVKLNTQIRQTLKNNGVEPAYIDYVISSSVKKRQPLADTPLAIKTPGQEQSEPPEVSDITPVRNPGGH